MTTPSFSQLLDWVDGRRDESSAAHVAAHVASAPDSDAAETVAWIRSFRSAGDTMPLETPPEDLGGAHIVLENDGTALAISVLRRRLNTVDLHGHLVWDGWSPRPKIVISGSDPSIRRVARPEASGGEFCLTEVSRSADEVWVLGPARSLHGRLELGNQV